MNTADLLSPVMKLAREAGEKILGIYHQLEQPMVDMKRDGSPVTVADKVSNDYLIAALRALTPEWPVLSEESLDIPYSERAAWEYYWLIDPLDGTKEFLQQTGDFTVNIALIERHQPILGIIYVPVSQMLYYAVRGEGAYKQWPDGKTESIYVSTPTGPVRVIASRRHAVEMLGPVLAQLEPYEIVYAGSALKFCRIAEGAADLYPRLGLTSEWDTAAGQCIVEAAGGYVLDQHGLPLRYNTGDSMLNPHFAVLSDKTHGWLEVIFKNEE